MEKDNQQDRIDAYLRGRASREERLEMEEEITRDAALSHELAATERAMAAIEQAGDAELKASLQALESSLAAAPARQATVTALEKRQHKTQARVVEMKRRRKGTLNLIGYAAALLIALAVGWWAFNTNTALDTEQLAMESFEPFANIATGTVRGAEDDSPEAAAFAAYDDGDYPAAAERFGGLPPTNVNRFYRGQSLLATGQFTEAAPLFADLAAQADFALAAESAYFRAICELGLGRVAEAKALLTPIATDTSHPMQAQAARALEKL